ncbi:MAG: carboxypeptidase regulatory-like domain-containing protein [Bryobacteraceae bacterium]|nr:carboxypeptidase regulatory-like domain-containing protein [Bryobacteraceae bacterium]
MRTTQSVFCASVLGLVLAVGMAGQQLTGSILGAVTDPANAGVVRARVVVRNTATQAQREVLTDEAGNYETAGLFPGTYSLSISSTGFQTNVVSNVELLFGSRRRVDVQLLVGEVATVVNVSGAAALIESESSRVAEALTEKQVLDLPYNNLSTLNLARFIPGTYPSSGNFEYSAAGLGNTMINQTFDGLVNNNTNGGLNGGYNFSPSLDAVQEVSYTLLNQSAENPFATTIAVVTKSGGPEFHGSLWWYLTNNSWNSRNFFAATAPTGKMNHRYGGTLGGPIVKNRTFFFADVQQERNQVLRQFNDLVPTAKVRRGDLSGLAPVQDPLTGQPFPGNLIPASRLNPVAQRVLDFYYQQPNIPRDANFGFFNQTGEYPTVLQHYSFRVDHILANNQNLAIQLRRQLFDDQSNLAAPNPAWGTIIRKNPTWLVSASHIWTASPSLVLDSRFGWNQFWDESSGDLNGATLVRDLGLQGYRATLPEVATVPQFNVTGITSFTSPRVPIRTDPVYNFSSAATWIRGAHTLKAGALTRWLGLYQQRPEIQTLFGSASFTGAYTGLGVGDLLLGLPRTSTTLGRVDNLNRKITQWHWFVQDDYRVNQNLTLNFGLRFESNPAPREKTGNLTFIFDRATGSIVVPGTEQLDAIAPSIRATTPFRLAEAAGYNPASLIGQRNWLWYPRIGAAWRPFRSSGTVLRAGYGIYANDNSNLFSPIEGPYTNNLTFDNAVSPQGALFALPRLFPDVGTAAIAPGTLNFTTQERLRRTPYVQEWNGTIEQRLPEEMTFRISYSGAKSTRLPFSYNLNQPPASAQAFEQSRRPFPLYRNITIAEFRGNAVFHGVTLVLSRRFSRGLLFDLSYMFSRELSDAFTYFGGNSEDRYNFSRDRGNNPYTPRQRFTASFIWQIPVGRGRALGRSINRVTDAVVGGWQMSGFTTVQTGTFFTPTFSGVDPTNTLRFGGRADVVGEWQTPSDERTLGRWFNRGALAIPASGRFGNAGPFSMEGPSRWSQDLGVYKEISLFGEKRFFRVEGTFINIFNHPNFANPIADITNPLAGAITSTNNIEGGGGRTVQVGLRYRF